MEEWEENFIIWKRFTIGMIIFAVIILSLSSVCTGPTPVIEKLCEETSVNEPNLNHLGD